MAFSEDGKARAGMGVDAADFDNSGRPGLAITNFDNEMIGLYRGQASGVLSRTWRSRPASGRPRAPASASAASSSTSISTAASICSSSNGHIDETVRNIRGNVGYAQAPHLFLNRRQRQVSRRRGGGRAADFARPKVGRGLACGDFDRDGDVDVLITTNNGPPVLFRNDQRRRATAACDSGWSATKSNRDAHRRDGPHLPRRHVAVAHGEERLELPLAVGTAGDLRRRHARPRRARCRRLAERPDRGVQESRDRQGLRRHRRQRHQLLSSAARPIHQGTGGQRSPHTLYSNRLDTAVEQPLRYSVPSAAKNWFVPDDVA